MDVDISSYNRPFIKRKYLKNLNAINIYMALPLVGLFRFARYSLIQLETYIPYFTWFLNLPCEFFSSIPSTVKFKNCKINMIS